MKEIISIGTDIIKKEPMTSIYIPGCYLSPIISIVGRTCTEFPLGGADCSVNKCKNISTNTFNREGQNGDGDSPNIKKPS